MARSRNSVAKKARHNKWIKRAKGFRGRRSTTFKLAKEAVLKAGQYAFRDRRKKKSVFRQLWQIKINAAARTNGISYSRLTNALRKSNIGLDRKILAIIAHEHPTVFTKIVEQAKESVK